MLRNSEFKKKIIFYILILVLMSAIAFVLNNDNIWIVILTAFVFIISEIIFNVKRYKNMQSLIEEIDKILHGSDNFKLSSYLEGDLSLLQNEISKMTIMLKNQKDLLIKDKITLSDSLADISHQIRTPLTSLNILASTLKKPDITEEKKQECLFHITRQLFHIDWLITALLKMARLESGIVEFRKENVDIKKLIDISLEPLEVMLELKNIKVKTECDGSFLGDIKWTSEAIGNIIKNAYDNLEEYHEIQIYAKENNLYSEIVIKDNGKGILKEDIPNLFDRFYKGRKSSSQSYGIGLALSKMIIVKQNGIIKAENSKDGGAVFTIRFYKSVV